MKVKANDIKRGNVISYNSCPHIVIKDPIHTKPGKGGAYVKLNVRNLLNNTTDIIRLNSSSYVEKEFTEQKKVVFLYAQENQIFLMDVDMCDEIIVDVEILCGRPELLDAGQELLLFMCSNIPVTLKLPDELVVTIEETSLVSKNDTVVASYKPAKLTNSLTISVPPYIEIYDEVIIKSEDLSFVSRVKK